MKERRQHVRVRPTAELPIEVTCNGTSLQIVDVSTGGFGFLQPDSGLAAGERYPLTLALGRFGSFDVDGEVRHVRPTAAGDLGGVQIVDAAEEAGRALRRYVGELFERGMSA